LITLMKNNLCKKKMKTLSIEEITFSTNAKTATCYGRLNLGHLSVSSKIHIDFHQLNIILNKLGLKGNLEAIYNSLNEIETPEGTYYSLKLLNQTNQSIPLSELKQELKTPLRISA